MVCTPENAGKPLIFWRLEMKHSPYMGQYCYKHLLELTHLFLMNPFSAPWKHLNKIKQNLHMYKVFKQFDIAVRFKIKTSFICVVFLTSLVTNK